MFRTRFLLVLLPLSLLSTTAPLADTVELVDGSLLEGQYVGGNKSSIMFETADEIAALETSAVVAVYFSAGVEAAEARAAAPSPKAITVPQGTRLMVRTSEVLDSRQHPAGHRFRGQLEGALSVDGQEIAPRGAMVYGHIAAAQQSGRVAGSSNLLVEFTDIMIGDQLHPIATTGLKAQTSNTAGTTARRTARTGAAVGAGASILTSGNSIHIPAGTLVETSLRSPLVIQ